MKLDSRAQRALIYKKDLKVAEEFKKLNFSKKYKMKNASIDSQGNFVVSAKKTQHKKAKK